MYKKISFLPNLSSSDNKKLVHPCNKNFNNIDRFRLSLHILKRKVRKDVVVVVICALVNFDEFSRAVNTVFAC